MTISFLISVFFGTCLRLNLLLGSARVCPGSTCISLCGWKGVITSLSLSLSTGNLPYYHLYHSQRPSPLLEYIGLQSMSYCLEADQASLALQSYLTSNCSSSIIVTRDIMRSEISCAANFTSLDCREFTLMNCPHATCTIPSYTMHAACNVLLTQYLNTGLFIVLIQNLLHRAGMK